MKPWKFTLLWVVFVAPYIFFIYLIFIAVPEKWVMREEPTWSDTLMITAMSLALLINAGVIYLVLSAIKKSRIAWNSINPLKYALLWGAFLATYFLIYCLMFDFLPEAWIWNIFPSTQQQVAESEWNGRSSTVLLALALATNMCIIFLTLTVAQKVGKSRLLPASTPIE